ncbi:hypothetical protein JQ597_25405 [Bradyrhizobium sp. AUGA SZCCT0177]|uniref:hypothetical protein n=1 Tax=Bradyrhizobium sp. AUGA SZCCT0177 TaxID=2807665 RepID=UPI001BACE2D5|nr:hypothetical protein [Bradyrhizobium sp. AUGA SZCCT0177]MBR1285392.1 hypothetical protein [Bradyrhizobium sp. AUGA SZCCT0177]
MHKEYSRRELYDLVWAKPMVKLAKEFGLSDVGLRKICVKHDIPTPPLGYWAKVSFGKPVQATPLEPPKSGISDRVLVSVFATVETPQEVVEAAHKAREQVQAPIAVPSEPPLRLHPSAQALNRALRSAKPDHEGFLDVSGPGILSANIGPSNKDRIVLLVDTLFKALDSAGHRIQATESGLKAVIDSEVMVLAVRETKDRTEHQPTKSELKAKADWEENRKKWPSLYDRERQHWRSWDNFPSGRMSLSLYDPLRPSWGSGNLLGRWHDRKTNKLESHINEILIAMLTGAAIVRHNRIAAETAERERQERHQAYLREQERLRREAQVDAFIEDKADQLFRLQKILSFRGYLTAQLTAVTSSEATALIDAVDDLVGRLQRDLSLDVLRRSVKVTD